jgi:hypothetical protein
METSERFISSDRHVVDWQLVRSTESYHYSNRDLRVQIRLLETQASTLSRFVLANPEATAKRESLAALDRQIASLRATLAWAGGSDGLRISTQD